MNKPKKFVSLHSHSGFSTYDGLDYPQDHIDFVIENGMDAWCLTDHGHMNGFAHAYLHNQKLNKDNKGLKFIPGCEMYLHPNLDIWKLEYDIRKATKDEDEERLSELLKQKEALDPYEASLLGNQSEIVHAGINKDDQGLTIEDEDESKASKYYDPIKRRHHLVVLPKTSIGLQRLFHLVSRGYSEGFYRFPRIDFKMLKEAAEGGHLVISSACIGGALSYEVFKYTQGIEFDDLKAELLDDTALMDRVVESIDGVYKQMIDAVGEENAFLELQFHNLNAQHLVNRALIEYATRYDYVDKLVVTADSHYSRPEHWRERELYKKLGWLNYKDFDPSELPESVDELKCQLYPKNAEQIWDTYKETTVAHAFYDDKLICDAIERTHGIAHDLIGDIHPDTSVKLPSYVVPEGKTTMQALIDVCKEGLIKRGLHKKPEYIARIKKELRVIQEKDFAKYFLTMKAILDIAREHMLIGPGRGSSAGSLVCYCLEITDVDPIEYKLLFERFLSKYRVEYPDIDTDISNRDLLIDLLKDEFGSNSIVPISNYNTFKLKTLVKDISRFYSIPYDEANAATKTVDEETRLAMMKHGDDKNLFVLTFKDAYAHCKSFRKFIDKYPHVAEPIGVLFKQNKALGRHAGGVIVSENIPERMPLIKAKGELQTPWVEGTNFKHLEHFGWIKFDLLGLETLRLIERTIELILKSGGIKKPTFKDIKQWYDTNLAPDVIDLNDQKVYDYVYGQGNFAGIFQLTSGGAQRLFKKAKPKSIIEIATLTSIYRPGPLAAKVDKLYLDNKADPENIVYEHPLIKQVLEPTYGMIIFQEQIMELAHVVAGFPKDECDKLRKAIMKRSISGGEAARKKAAELELSFISGSVANGIEEHTAKDLYKKILYYAGYGFNLAHAVSYAIDSYFCAFLMTHYEPQWLCAYLEAMSSSPIKKTRSLQDARSLGYEIIPIDINIATDDWTILPNKQFMPALTACKGVGESAALEIIESRPFTDIKTMLWKDDGKWKPSKFNKTALQNLIKIGAFESMNLVGEGREFTSYRHMYESLIPHYNRLKRSLKKDAWAGFNEFEDHRLTNLNIGGWNKIERVEHQVELLGGFDPNSYISPQMMHKFQELNVECFDDYVGENVYWFIVLDTKVKLTKNKKKYLLLDIVGLDNSSQRLYCWGGDPENSRIGKYKICVAELKKSDFGFATTAWKIKILN